MEEESCSAAEVTVEVAWVEACEARLPKRDAMEAMRLRFDSSWSWSRLLSSEGGEFVGSEDNGGAATGAGLLLVSVILVEPELDLVMVVDDMPVFWVDDS